MVSASNFDQGDAEQPISAMTDGAKCSENDRWTFRGSDQTPGLCLEDAVEVVEAVVVDEILTCIGELQLV
jgi:hypothetical protein